MRDTTECLSDHCLIQLSAFYEHSTALSACFDCMIYGFDSFETLAAGENECLTDLRAPFAFAGASTNMILSRYPLLDTQTYVLPGTGFRRAILYAQVQLDEEQTVDFYCGQLISPLIDTEVPYVGNYGNDVVTTLPDGGESVENGWEDEQDLQVKRAIAFIRATSARSGRPAIIAGDWHASSIVRDESSNAVIVGDQSPEVLRALGQAFDRAEPTAYVERCQYCPAPLNIYNGTTVPEDFTQTYLSGFPSGSTLEDSLWATESNVPIKGSTDQPPPDGGLGPISAYFPRVVKVVRPPTGGSP